MTAEEGGGLEWQQGQEKKGTNINGRHCNHSVEKESHILSLSFTYIKEKIPERCHVLKLVLFLSNLQKDKSSR